MTARQADQKWVEDTRAEYLRRARATTWFGPVLGLLGFAMTLRGVVP